MGNGKNKPYSELLNSFQGSIKYLKQELYLALQMELGDEMRFQTAITIATRLRMLLNDEGRNLSLLEQLHLKKKILFDLSSKGSVDLASNLVFSATLLGLKVDNSQLFWTPNKVVNNNNVFGYFDEWWNEIIIDDKGRNPNQVSRRDVILTLCDKEGGAHLDPEYDEAYYAITFGNGWKFIDGGIEKSTVNNPYAESVFVIAEEFLNAIDLYNNLNKNNVRDASTDNNLICIKYKGINPKLKVHRLAFNPSHRLSDVLRIAYDYYRDAEYSLIGLKYKRFLDQKNRLIRQFLVVDKNQVSPLYYLRKENEDRYVLLGDDKGLYRVIKDDSDIYKSEKGQPLESLIEELRSI